MENRETTTGQAVQCKKTDWFKKIYGDMICDEESRSITRSIILPDGTRIEINPMWFDMYMSDSRNVTRTGTVSSRATAMKDETIERIFVSEDSAEII